MRTSSKIRKKINRLFLPHLTIQQRLPLFICILLICAIALFTGASYIGVKRAALEVGSERLRSLTEQLSSMFEQSFKAVTSGTKQTAEKPAVKQFFQVSSEHIKSAALSEMESLGKDKETYLIQLLDTSQTPMLKWSRKDFNSSGFDSLLPLAAAHTDSVAVGQIYNFSDSMYYPVVAKVTEHKRLLGYLVRWRRVLATPRAIEQLSQLIGTNAALYFGNADGKFWTDLLKPVLPPPVPKRHKDSIMTYERKPGNKVLAAQSPIANSRMVVLVEFSRQRILEAADRFLSWLIIIGAVVVAVGILVAWRLSRSIIRPLNKLTAATSALAGGDYRSLVNINRRDEIGRLARAFNEMATEIKNAQEDLEKKVQDRTAQLEAANKELEAFSYSVSHDLRAPLRAISGYSMILKEDYEDKLDGEANRVLNTVITNARMMGQLIDDLIEFSRLGKKDLRHAPVDMKALASECVKELMPEQGAGKYKISIDDLPACNGDLSFLKQVWLNLISNAIKYSSKEPEPCIHIGYEKEADGSVVYYIKDNGVGFDMQYAHKLFGVFQRLHGKEMFEGTGVGLALVKRIIQRHNGRVWGESFDGKGAAFYFSLPK